MSESPAPSTDPGDINYCACGHAEFDHARGGQKHQRCRVLGCGCGGWDHDPLKDFENQYP